MFQEFKEMANNSGSGRVDYRWSKPGEKGECAKTGFIRKIPNMDMFIGVGYYT